MLLDNHLVAVMVPAKHLTKVYGYIASLDNGHASGASTPALAPKPVGAKTSDEWTPSRLRRMLEQSPPAIKDILRSMASRPGEWLTTEELAHAIQGNDTADWKTVAGTMGAFGRRLKNRYGLESFPFEKRHDHVKKSKTYRMSQEISPLVIQVLNDG